MPASPVLERAAVPLVAYLALASFTSTQGDAAGRAESAFLALSTAGMLAVIAALGAAGGARRSASELAWTALLATAAIWIAYQGPSRGAVVSCILLVGLVVSAARAVCDETAYDETGRLRSADRLDPGVTVALALGLQLLMRGDLLLAPLLEPRTLVSLLMLPLAAGWAVSLLAARFGAHRALMAGGVTVVLAPGWTVTSTLAICALAAGVLVADKEQPKVFRWGAVAALALLPWWSFSKGLLFGVAGLSMVGLSLTTAPLLLVAVALIAVKGPLAQVPIEAIRQWLGAVLLVPAAVVAPGDGRFLVRLGGLLALGAALVSSTPETMAAGIALAALGLPIAGAVAILQRTWSVVAVVGTVLLSAYPWVRQDPLGDLIVLLGSSHDAVALLKLLALVVGVGLLIDRLKGVVPRWMLRPVPVACLFLAWPVAWSVGPSTVKVDSYQPVVLEAGSAPWRADVPGQLVTGLVIDSHLTRGAVLGPGKTVAVVELLGADGQALAEWKLRAGVETGEWAAARADLASQTGFVAPEPWLSSVAPGGAFFARRYRAQLTTTKALPAARLWIRRAQDLPPDTVLSIYRVEIRQ